MQRFIPGPLPDHARNILRRLGYGEQQNSQGQISFNRRFSNAPFPKYHAYVEDKNGGLQVNLHIDQKAASYDDSRAHNGEYEGPLVEQEMQRIALFVTSLVSQTQAGREDNPSSPKKGGFFGGLFGG